MARATIADVAARSGVSTATVSRVLSGTAPATPTTRDRVLAAVAALGYRPLAAARALKRNETQTIGLLVTDIENPFFPQIVRAVEDEARRHGLGVLLCNAADDPVREEAYLDLLLERRIDGLVVASSRTVRRHAARLAGALLPVVVVNAGGRVRGLSSVTTAHRHGLRLAVQHLTDLGHRRIAYVTGPRSTAAARERRAGAEDAVRAAGLDPGALTVADGDERVSGGIAAATALLGMRPPPTAIACYNDLTAVGVLMAARSLGVRVPEDLSVVGFDDVDLASWTQPRLTTVRQPTDAMGRLAVWRLMEERRVSTGRPLHAVLEPTLVVRESTARPQGTE